MKTKVYEILVSREIVAFGTIKWLTLLRAKLISLDRYTEKVEVINGKTGEVVFRRLSNFN
ncbi:hypothetical protein GW796_09785 [archaeon]|nr:hypothetical protein [archaeon]